MSSAGVENSLKVHRARNNLTQAELAGLADITRASVNAIEGGRMVPSVFLALRLAGALGVTVDELFWLPAVGAGKSGAKPALSAAPGAGSAKKLLPPRLSSRRSGANR